MHDEAEYVAADVSRLAATVRVLAVGVARRLDSWQSEKLVAFTVDVRVVFGEDSLTALSVSGCRMPRGRRDLGQPGMQ